MFGHFENSQLTADIIQITSYVKNRIAWKILPNNISIPKHPNFYWSCPNCKIQLNEIKKNSLFKIHLFKIQKCIQQITVEPHEGFLHNIFRNIPVC